MSKMAVAPCERFRSVCTCIFRFRCLARLEGTCIRLVARQIVHCISQAAHKLAAMLLMLLPARSFSRTFDFFFFSPRLLRCLARGALGSLASSSESSSSILQQRESMGGGYCGAPKSMHTVCHGTCFGRSDAHAMRCDCSLQGGSDRGS
jgi:hypothetical protein